MVVDGLVVNAFAAMQFAAPAINTPIDATETFRRVEAEAARVRGGDLGGVETILTGQLISLNALFGDLSILGRRQMKHNVVVSEKLLRLAFKAQSQCRAVAEALTYMKNPGGGAVFTRQANFANGPQQVNNAPPPPAELARAPRLESAPNELLALEGGGVESLDGRQTQAASPRDSRVAPVGKIDGAQER